jgi:CRISPR-associated protein Csd1
MILQSLANYYHRLVDEQSVEVASLGFETKAIPFLIVLNNNGNFVNLRDTRDDDNKRGRKFIVPQAEKKTSGIKANLLWDSPAYVLGKYIPNEKKEISKQKRQEQNVPKQHEAFIERFNKTFPASFQNDGINAIRRFFEKGDFPSIYAHPRWQEVEKINGNLSFILETTTGLISQDDAVMRQIMSSSDAVLSDTQACLVTGGDDVPAILHTAIKGVWGTQTSGANIVSFNQDAFCSFGKWKNQGLNAPVGSKAQFAYTTALNTLLTKGSRQRMQVGDASTVFWAKEKHPIEQEVLGLFAEPDKKTGKDNTEYVRSLITSVKTGVYPPEDELPFYMLGLSPNAARISVRFWYEGTVKDFKRKICDHFEDILIEHGPKQSDYLSLFRLLVCTAVDGKADNIQPNLAGEFMQSILKGTPYPRSLLPAVLRRIKAEQSKRSPDGRVLQNVTYPRASLIKGVLVRNARYYLQKEKEVGVSLDRENGNIGYRLGRLFAVLERVQQSALGDINATIRDRFYGAASTNPVTVFPRLMKLKNYHISKIENKGRVVNLEKEISEILKEVTAFPTYLSLEDQGRFAIGYYHERNDFFTKHDKKEGGQEE